jgi:hypothetical protein
MMHGPVSTHTHNCVTCGKPTSCQTPECFRRDVVCEPCIERSYEKRHGHAARVPFPGYRPLEEAPRPLPIWDRREVRDYFGVAIKTGDRIAYVSPGMRPTLSHGTVLGLEQNRRRLLRSAMQVHVKTHRGTHVRLHDPQRVIVLGR